MAKLNATVDQIQLTSNMIKSGDTTDWTDANYPSAKSVSNLIDTKIAAIIPAEKFEHPIGSVLITSTNTNPAASIGGEWSLIDKEYSNAVGSIAGSPYWIPAMSGTTPRAELSGFVIRTDHLIHLTLQLTTKVALSLTSSGSSTLGTIDHDLVGGVPNLPMSFGFTGSAFAHATYTSNSTTESCTVRYSIGATGDLTIFEIHNTTKQLPIDAKIYINTSIPMSHEYMGDSFCDKFYWKRTA